MAKQVKVALDWTPNTNHVGFYVARAKGFFADVGLDVQVRRRVANLVYRRLAPPTVKNSRSSALL